ncbi:unnamed protein product [Rotaria sordida]|uniref:RWD domain-containing protein n=1 Tax=Rotaria sordida TaxID=392033 RepID=A0A819CA92_9BILA|nr:unnamed protein product [Rotaria sordida]CAF1273014.1 unnamed protein product [Rotaria sordida]CAF1359854.1 unnamed protein product [Rotaria sordida]CAF1448745.1 unnamed protein product [Rotaria sordida]CAF1638229.1 unnamed protein product [Rotaria sordida]
MDEELTVLKSIYLDDLIINNDQETSISITIYSNGDENDFDPDKRLLFITLIAELPSTYPDIDSPKITLCRSRGLTDQQLDELNSLISSCLELNSGSCVLYECIELIRSKLSLYELPHEACAICLTLINNRNDIIKTNCHHFYHKNCLASYVQIKKNELEEKYQEAIKCKFAMEKDFRNDIEDPVCRQILSSTVIEQLPSSTIETINNKEENRELIKKLSPNIRQWQERTHALFQQQKEKGGIINLDKTQEIIFS